MSWLVYALDNFVENEYCVKHAETVWNNVNVARVEFLTLEGIEW